MAAPAVTIRDAAALEAAGPCPWGVFEDLVDVFLLAGVFCVGWLLVRLFTGRFGGRVPRAVKSKGNDLWTPVAEESSAAPSGSCGNGGSPEASVDDADTAQDSMRAAEEETAKWVEALLPPPAAPLDAPCTDPLDDLLDIVGAEYSPAPADDMCAPNVCAGDDHGLIRAAGRTRAGESARSKLIASARAGDMVQASQLIQELTAAGTPPDGAALGAVIRGYCAAGEAAEALSLFQELRAAGMTPKASVFNALLMACEQRGLLQAADGVLAEMRRAAVAPTSATLAARVRMHAARGELRRAARLFEELPVQYNFEADAIAYHALIVSCTAGGQVPLAQQAFTSMTAAGVVPCAKTYEALVVASMRRGQLAQAVDFVRHAYGIPPVACPEAPATRRRATLERPLLEELLKLLGRRSQAATFGVPLLHALEEASVELSEGPAARGGRAAALRRWRSDFGHAA